MALFDIKIPGSIARALHIPVSDARRVQIKVLKKLLRKARFTQFGQLYKFDEILLSIKRWKVCQMFAGPVLLNILPLAVVQVRPRVNIYRLPKILFEPILLPVLNN